MPVLPEVRPNEARTRINENGRIIIPAAIRNMLGFEIGDEVLLVVEDGELRVTTPRKRAERSQILYRRYAREDSADCPNLVVELIADRRREAASE
jgi:antitoxin PrlF